MADDEVTKMVNKLGDLNSVTFQAGLEFTGLTKRLITMSDSVSGAGKKWTIFARLVSGSPLWRLQNKFRAFIDILGQIEQTSQANAEAARKQNQRVIDQSNVAWRRQINTANTSAVNAANQTDAANLMNMSNFAMSALWQQWRDEASWANTSSENIENRNHNIVLSALEREAAMDLVDETSKISLNKLIGGIIATIIKDR